MIGYTTVGVSDLTRAKDFYTSLLADMGIQPLMGTERLQLFGNGMGPGMFAICLPFDGQPNHPGNGNMSAIACDTKDQVDAMYRKAIELGASCEGEPGQRMPFFYGAYFRDLDGNKLCFFKMDLGEA